MKITDPHLIKPGDTLTHPPLGEVVEISKQRVLCGPFEHNRYLWTVSLTFPGLTAERPDRVLSRAEQIEAAARETVCRWDSDVSVEEAFLVLRAALALPVEP